MKNRLKEEIICTRTKTKSKDFVVFFSRDERKINLKRKPNQRKRVRGCLQIHLNSIHYDRLCYIVNISNQILFLD
jgi:hypothetical protein